MSLSIQMRNNPLTRWQTLFALLLVCLIIFAALFADVLAPLNAGESNGFHIVGNPLNIVPLPPNDEAVLGTAPGQIDVFTALIHGTRNALLFGLGATVLTALVGVLIGSFSGLTGGWFNQLSMRITDAFLCIPIIAGIAFFDQILTMLKMSVIGDADWYMISPVAAPVSPFVSGTQAMLLSLNPVMLALIGFCWMSYARVLNLQVLQVKQMEFITAARAIGTKPLRILHRHILPNCIAPIIILAAKDIGQMVILQAMFTFIGFPGNSAWADVLVRSRDWVIGAGGNPFLYWWTYIPITAVIILFGIAWNLLGDELNHMLDPKQWM
jgi:ABC-type dipeptide/oligopeptide/nickel transport system permease subunit